MPKMYYVDVQTKFWQRTLIFFKKAEISALTPVLIHILMIPYTSPNTHFDDPVLQS